MKLRNLFGPLYLAGRLQNWIYERRHPDHPWLAPAAIVWLEQHLRPDMLWREPADGEQSHHSQT